MRQRTLAAIAVAALLLSAGCVGSVTSGAADGQAAQSETNRSIEVSSTGTVQTQPDQAVLIVGVSATATDPSEARKRLAANVSEMTSALEEMGVGSDQLVTVDYDLREDRRHERRRGDDSESRYRARHTFRVTLTDTEKVGKAIDTAVQNGANEVQNVRYTISKEKRQDLRQQALENAMGNARRQADTVAASANLSVEGVVRVRSTDYDSRPRYGYRYAEAAADAGASPESGSVAVTARVNVVYNASA